MMKLRYETTIQWRWTICLATVAYIMEEVRIGTLMVFISDPIISQKSCPNPMVQPKTDGSTTVNIDFSARESLR